MAEKRFISGLLLNLDITLDVITDLRKISLHAVSIFGIDDLEQFLQFSTDLRHLIVGVGVEENFLQEVVVFVEHTLGDAHVTLEGGTRGILVFHDGSKHERRHERY